MKSGGHLEPMGLDAFIQKALFRILEANGEAIYCSRPWIRAEGTTREGIPVRFTCRDGMLYATLLGTPTDRVVRLMNIPATEDAAVARLGCAEAPGVRREANGDLRIETALPWPDRPAHCLRLGRTART